MAGLLGALRENSKHEDEGLWLFELGRRYLPTEELRAGTGLARERRTLGIALTGPLAQSWIEGVRDADFYDLKGIVETLLEGLHVSGYRFVAAQHPTFHPGRSAALEVMPAAAEDVEEGAERPLDVEAGWLPVAVLGEVHPEVAERFDLSGRVYVLELDLERLFLAVPERIRQTPIPRYPPAQRDLAVVVDESVPAARIAEVIRTSGGALVRDVRLFDVYTGEGIPAGKKSLAYALSYQSPERTLTDAEVERTHAAIVAALRQRVGAELRA
jgi:phenylalanyl-tRNA synthetase beta chain